MHFQFSLCIGKNGWSDLGSGWFDYRVFPHMSLNDAKIRSIKPATKPFKVSDSQGLYLLVNPSGSRLWYLKYRINSKESHLSLGAYPLVSLADARLQSDGIRKWLTQNINPAQVRVVEKSICSPETYFK